MKQTNLLNVAAMDPSMNNWGLVRATYNQQTKELLPNFISVIVPPFVKPKRGRQNVVDILNGEFLAKGVIGDLGPAPVVFSESPVGSQKARASVGYGMCIQLIAVIKASKRHIINVNAEHTKLALTGNPSADKDDMIEAAVKLYPDLDWPRWKLRGNMIINKGKAEHMADAIGTLLYGIDSEPFKEYLKTLSP